jgi:Rab-3A-interacting protein
MVNTAQDETAQSNKLLNEANGKIDVLEAELKALKALFLTSTPSEPNRHLHPHLFNGKTIQFNGNNQFSTPNNKPIKSGHKRTPSYNDVMRNYYQNIQQQIQQVESNLKNEDNSINSAFKCDIFEVYGVD